MITTQYWCRGMPGSLGVGGGVGSGSTGSQGHRMDLERNSTPGAKTASTISNVVNESGEVKPRSLRFTWSMKTTSSRDPNEIMAEIKKVNYWHYMYRLPHLTR